MMKNKRIFVSGGAGVIGQELVTQLARDGAQVMVGDLKPKPERFTSDCIYRQGDLNAMVQEEWNEFHPDVFIHLAATFERTTESAEFAQSNFHNNVALSNHLLDMASRQANFCRIVFASSYLVYDSASYMRELGANSPLPLTEDAPKRPRNLVGAAKYFHEKELESASSRQPGKLSTVSARIFRGYGCGSRDVISRWVRAALRGEAICTYDTAGKFDYIYSRDSAAALIALADQRFEGPVNVGSGGAVSVNSVIRSLQEHFPRLRVKPLPDSDIVENSQADITLISRATSWRPTVSTVEAIAEIIAFESSRQVERSE